MNKILNKIYIVEMLLILLLIIYAIFSILETNNLNKELETLNDKIDNVNEEIETYVSEISVLEDKILELQGQINSNRSRIKELEYITSKDYILGDYVYTSAIIHEIEDFGNWFIYLVETTEYGVGVVYSEDIYNINDIVLVGLHYNLPSFIVGKIG